MRARCEVDGLSDGTAVVLVEVRFGGDGSESHPFVGDIFGPVSEMTAVDCNFVAFVGESMADFMYALLSATGHVGMHDITHVGNIYRLVSVGSQVVILNATYR